MGETILKRGNNSRLPQTYPSMKADGTERGN
jgi:hypothetical protein